MIYSKYIFVLVLHVRVFFQQFPNSANIQSTLSSPFVPKYFFSLLIDQLAGSNSIKKIETEKSVYSVWFIHFTNKATVGRKHKYLFFAQLACEFAWIWKYLQASCSPHF